jgi:hypothetical protein
MAGKIRVEFTDELKLDFDQKHSQKRLSIPRLKFVSRLLRLPIEDVEAFRTANGIHVKIKLREKVHPITAVLIQSLMGSDYGREAYNAIRVYNLTLNPEKYDEVAHECWNVLYYRKYVDGRVASEERPDPKLTRRLKRELLRSEEKGELR